MSGIYQNEIYKIILELKSEAMFNISEMASDYSNELILNTRINKVQAFP